jgi:uncharacterized membrane protein
VTTDALAPQPAFERLLVRVMLAGVLVSTAVLSSGLVWLLLRPASVAGQQLLDAGLVVLMATPMVRVALSIAEALRRRDWFWLWSTAAVVVVLLGTVAYSLRTR